LCQGEDEVKGWCIAVRSSRPDGRRRVGTRGSSRVAVEIRAACSSNGGGSERWAIPAEGNRAIREHREGIVVSTRALLTCGVAAGPLYLAVALGQALTRDGFDITRHAVSLLSLGALGWIQVANFVVTGLLVLGCALGLRAALRGDRAGTWGPILLGVYGAALMASGVFPADAGFGYPPGTPAGPPATMTTPGTLHFAVGGIGFMALIAACLVFARRYFATGEAGMAWLSAGTGVAFLVAFMGIASGPPRPATVLGLWLGLTLTWFWLATVAWRTRSAVASADPGLAMAGAPGGGMPSPT